ncbi:MAG: glutamate-cysteine ligase family protein [Candidatus Hodarchaeota archaeon]
MDKKQIKELVTNAKKIIKEADKLAKKGDVPGAFQSYKRAADWLQKAGDMDLLQEVMYKMENLAQPSPSQSPSPSPSYGGALLNFGDAPPQKPQPQVNYQQQQAAQQQAAYQQQQAAQQQAVYQQQQAAQQQAAARAAQSSVKPPARQAGGWTPLVFTHGQELEVQLVRVDGTFPSGEEMVHMMEEIVKDARMKLIQWIDNQQVPPFIAQKIGTRNLPLKTDEEKGLLLQVPYPLPDGNRLNIDSFGRDGNVAAITYILELVTPPCQFVEELAWWESTLFALAYEVLPGDLHIVSTALNPMQEYMRGLSFGDHSHIGTFNSPLEKMQFYDMIRNFIPAIIALSVNSPIMQGKPTDEIKIVKGRYAAPNCVRSIRLLKNTTMLSSNNPARYIPYILDDTEENRQYFLQTLQKADFYDARFQDVYPFTDFGTIEVRICDAQLSIARRMGLSMLFQTLGYKTRKLLAQGKYVPGASSECLVKNREKAIKQGLFGTFTTEGIDEQAFRQYDQEFANMYLGKPGEKVRYMFQHVERLLKYLAPELKELGYANSPYIQPLLLSVFGEIPNITPPFCEAEFQLSLYAYKQSQRQDTNIVPDLIRLSKQYALNNTSHPLAGRVNYPPEYQ